MSTSQTAALPPAVNAEITKFKSAIIDMDALSQGGFSKISSIAKLTLAAMEVPGHHHQENIENSLAAIWSIANDIENCINARAEDVGANFIDDGLRRRRAARASTTLVEGSAA